MAPLKPADPARHEPQRPGPGRTSTAIIPLNDAAELFAALAESIRGSAVGWSAPALQKLEISLLERYGQLLGGQRAIGELVELARRPVAA